MFQNNGLRCPVPGCKTTIRGVTGFDEINKLRKHYAKAHWANITMEEALTLRIKIENAQTPS